MQISTGFIRRSWIFLGNTKVSLCLIYALFADVMLGSIVMRHNPQIFFPLKNQFLQEWIFSYGIKNMALAWWLFAAIFLLFFLSVSTTVCITNNLIFTVKHLGKNGFLQGFLMLAPSVMHTGFLLLLMGQLLSHTVGVNSHGNILTVGVGKRLPGSDIRIVLNSLKVDFSDENTHFPGMAGRPENCTGILSIVDQKGCQERVIALNRPVIYRGWSFFIEDFCPMRKGSKRSPFINMVIRRDPGVMLMVVGAVIFGVGLIMYLFSVTSSRNNCERG